jgi:hypothetical protein
VRRCAKRKKPRAGPVLLHQRGQSQTRRGSFSMATLVDGRGLSPVALLALTKNPRYVIVLPRDGFFMITYPGLGQVS